MEIHNTIWHISHFDLTLRMILSLVLGGCIGLEREMSNHAAGLRTHILVCLGSTTIMLLSIYGFSDFMNDTTVRGDPARLAAQVISGIGFLGAGAIMRNGSTVSGLTTAASIWVVAAIGLSVGAGFYYVSFLTAILVLFCLFVLNHWEKYLIRKRKQIEFTLGVSDKPASLSEVINKLVTMNIQVLHIQTGSSMERMNENDSSCKITIRISVSASNDEITLTNLLNTIGEIPDVLLIEPGASHVHKIRNKYEHSRRAFY